MSSKGKVKFFNEAKGYLALELGNVTHLYQAAYLFGAVGIGLQLPATAFTQSEHGQMWTVVEGAPIAGEILGDTTQHRH